ncbi:MAG: TIGR00282 family metallophosphoesterase [Acidobacteria bacterium]|nr:TIGR00282 family metallophosphoesterase [Acidobacteriota bacterium]
MIRLLFIGDIFARSGRDIVRRALPALVRSHQVELVIANGENAAGGAGLQREQALDLFRAGVHVITGGNHIWDKRELLTYIAQEPRIVRPGNYPAGTPGAGAVVVHTAGGVRVGVINLMGRVYLSTLDDPFAAADRLLDATAAEGAKVTLVDFHAEVTSEKIALCWHLEGRATAVVGTHTHVQTADERLLPGGTACITDVGMTGPHNGVIGMDRAGVIARFRTGLPGRFAPADGDIRLHGVLIDADETTGRASAITRVALNEVDVARLTAEGPAA